MRLFLLVLSLHVTLLASSAVFTHKLTLDEAIKIIHKQNLEVKVATLDERGAKEATTVASANNWGVLDFTQDFANSNDAGNVFGFKLSSREATFNDFGAEEFMNNFGSCQGGDMSACTNMYNKPPDNLNYPESRNYFKSKLSYMLPLYTGGKLSSYQNITEAMANLKHLDKVAILNEKIYQTKKSYYDMALLEQSIEKISSIEKNIETLEIITHNMIEEGYAKKVDLLEVQAKKANVIRTKNQLISNQKLLYHFLSYLLNQNIKYIAIPSTDVVYHTTNTEVILEQNIDIKKVQSALSIHNEMKDISRASYLPTLGVMGEVSTADDTFLGDVIDHASYTVGAQLKWNIFNGGADKASNEKAHIEYLKMKTQVELAKKGILLQVKKIETEIMSFDYEIDSLSKELNLQTQILENYEGRYKEQLTSMSDVIIKQSLLIESVLQLLHVKNQRNERIFALNKLTSGELQ